MGAWASAWKWGRAAVLLLGAAVLAWIGWKDVGKILAYQPPGIDFLPMWAAAHEVFVHPHRVYDFDRLTRFEQPELMHYAFRGIRPFVYPPPALLAFAPFGRWPFALANVIWTLIGLAAVVLVTAFRLKAFRWLAILVMILSPASLLVLVTGQVSFLIAAMGMAGLLCVEKRPLVAGVLFGVAGAIKPQAMALLPVALFAIGAWRTILVTALTAAAAVGLSVLTFGVGAWLAWIAALGRFGTWVMATPGLVRGMITPTALGITLKLDPAAQDVWRLSFGVGAIAMVWMVFRHTEDLARRMTALFGGALFLTPYAMHYDAALLAPAAALMLTGRDRPGDWFAALVAATLLCCAAVPHWGAAAVTAFVLIGALMPETAFANWPRRRAVPAVAPGEATA